MNIMETHKHLFEDEEMVKRVLDKAMGVYECRDIKVYIQLSKAGFEPFNTRYDNDGVCWLYEYSPLMKPYINNN